MPAMSEMSGQVDVLRDELRAADLDERSVAADPLAQFRAWYRDAEAAQVEQPDAMVLATTDRSGRPSARVVLLRGLDEHGFVFYTNLESDKGRELAENPRASLVFHWREIARQVRVSGGVEAVPRGDADRYFASRPRASRIGAWASPQSAVLTGRSELDRLLADTEARFSGTEPPLPPFWGGFVVAIESLELWQAREARLHDRIRYRRANDGAAAATVTGARQSGEAHADATISAATWLVERLGP
jgi:pyridoxamine 5'-phosphate oxidase